MFKETIPCTPILFFNKYPQKTQFPRLFPNAQLKYLLPIEFLGSLCKLPNSEFLYRLYDVLCSLLSLKSIFHLPLIPFNSCASWDPFRADNNTHPQHLSKVFKSRVPWGLQHSLHSLADSLIVFQLVRRKVYGIKIKIGAESRIFGNISPIHGFKNALSIAVKH